VSAGQRVAQLTGTGRLADDLYLMAHHDVSGRPFLQPRATGLGLAGALLAELVLARRIDIGPQGVVAASRKPPQDKLAARVLDQVARERERRPAGEWLAFLGTTAAADVAGRLEEAGYLTRVASRRPRHSPRWVPADSDCAFVAVARARAALDPARPVTAPAAVLAGLAAACGLCPRLLAYAAPGARSPEDAALELRAGLRDLIAQTRAAVDSAVLAHRV
jgi:Golgi phosphoprotein 3 (GPP34)